MPQNVEARSVLFESREGKLGVAWPIWTVLASATWLLPTHAAPWPTVYAEGLIAASLLTIAFWLLWTRKPVWRVDWLATGFALSLLVPLLQAFGSQFLYAGEAPLVGLYLIGIASAIVIGRAAEESTPGRLADALFASLLIAGLVSTGMALAQWLSVDPIGALLAPMPFQDRPVANVGQPNNLATMLVWSLLAVWRMHWRRQVAGACAVLAAAFLLVGVMLTQSRAGFLQVMLIAAVALFARRTLRTSAQWPAWTGLLLWFLACYLLLEPLTRAWTEQIARPMLNTDSPRERLTLLQVDFAAIAAHPWTGWGWNQNVVAHVALAERFPMHGVVGNAHNLVLDLLIWNGVPLGALMTCGLLWWCGTTVKKLERGDDLLLALALGTFSVHTMLELPHVLAFFLVPASLIVGTLNARVRAPTLLRLPRRAVGVGLVAWAVMFATLYVEYVRIETEEVDAAVLAAWPGTPRPPVAPRALLLGALQDSLHDLRTEPRRGMHVDALAKFRRAVTRYPRRGALFRYAEAAAVNGAPQDARWALERLCDLHPAEACAAAASDWSLTTRTRYPELATVAVPRNVAP